MLLTLKIGRVTIPPDVYRPPIVESLLAAAEQGVDLVPVITEVCHRYGYDSFMYATSLAVPPTAETRQWVYTTLSPQWVRRYDAQDYADIDLRVKHCLLTTLPLVWVGKDYLGQSPELDEFVLDANRNGVASGLCFGMRDGHYGMTIVAFNSIQENPTPEVLARRKMEAGEVMMWSAYFNDLVVRQTVEAAFAAAEEEDRKAGNGGTAPPGTASPAGAPGKPIAEGAPLSPRQLQTLQLAARGFLGKKIANELHIEPRTVLLHWEAIRTKLGARTREEAVAIAIRRSLIQP